MAIGYVSDRDGHGVVVRCDPLLGPQLYPCTGRSVTSWVDCLGDGLVPCPYVGYPQGVDLSVSGALVTGTFLLTRLGIGVEEALNILSLLALAVGVASLWALAASIARSAAAGAVAASPVLPLADHHRSHT